MTLESINKIIADNKDGVIDDYTVSAEQAKLLLAGYNSLQDSELKQHYLNQSVFWLLSVLTKCELKYGKFKN